MDCIAEWVAVSAFCVMVLFYIAHHVFEWVIVYMYYNLEKKNNKND